MNLSKLSILLCLAFQESDGPFHVSVECNQGVVWAHYTKQQIGELSDIECIVCIDVCEPRSDRRWHQRLTEDRRK
jgi:hypothetical protein